MLIQGRSMEPSYHNLQLAVIDKREHTYTAGDVVAFRCEGLSDILVKRIVACPGDTVVIREGTLFVNDRVSPVFDTEGAFQDAGLLSELVSLEADQYIVMGDNIAESVDSRYPKVGVVSKTDIIGYIFK